MAINPHCLPPLAPCWKTNMPIKLTINPTTDTTISRSCFTSGGSNALCVSVRERQSESTHWLLAPYLHGLSKYKECNEKEKERIHEASNNLCSHIPAGITACTDSIWLHQLCTYPKENFSLAGQRATRVATSPARSAVQSKNM